MTIYRIEETALHHSVYEVDADSPEQAMKALRDNYEAYLVEEFWGDTYREAKEVEA